MMEEVAWKKGVHFKVDAAVAAGVIDGVRKKHGGDVTPAALVEAAKPKRSPIHGEFEWDNDTAGLLWREAQARLMIRAIVIKTETDKESPIQFRKYELQRLPGTENKPSRNVYRTVEDIMADPNARAELLARALRELIAFRNRYKGLQELAIVMRATEEVLATVDVE